MLNTNNLLISAILTIILSGCIQDDTDSSDSKTKEDFYAEMNDIGSDTTYNDAEYTYMSKTIEAKDIKKVNVDLSMDCGKFEIYGTDKVMLKGDFRYKTNQQKPVINYRENEEKEGALAICMKWSRNEEKNIDNSDCKAFSKIAINNKVPMDMNIEFGAGKADFNLEGMPIKNIDIQSGAGQFNVNLSNTSIEKIEMAAGVGQANIDLSGQRTNDLKGNFACGIGEITILLPSDVNIEVHTSGVLGSINAKGFNRNKRNLSFKPEKESKVDIDLDIAGGIGEINLILDK